MDATCCQKNTCLEVSSKMSDSAANTCLFTKYLRTVGQLLQNISSTARVHSRQFSSSSKLVLTKPVSAYIWSQLSCVAATIMVDDGRRYMVMVEP